jgi:hypothetical protein
VLPRSSAAPPEAAGTGRPSADGAAPSSSSAAAAITSSRARGRRLSRGLRMIGMVPGGQVAAGDEALVQQLGPASLELLLLLVDGRELGAHGREELRGGRPEPAGLAQHGGFSGAVRGRTRFVPR